jgi:hypothetical protein
MQQPDFRLPIEYFVNLLVAGDYQAAVDQSFHQDRLQASGIAEAIHPYPGRLTTPPASAYRVMQVYKYDDGSGYMLAFFLWVDQEPSDLMIKIDAVQADNEFHYTLWDMLVS